MTLEYVFVFLLFGILCTVVQSVILDSRLVVLQKSYIYQYSLDFIGMLLEVHFVIVFELL